MGSPVVSGTARPAFYALAPGGWRDYVTLLHPPYTLWHLSYVAIGAALAPHFRAGIFGLALLAFFLGMGVAAHALDELHSRPLETRIGRRTLIAVAYNLELFGGRLHGDPWFSLSWGAFPVLTTFFAVAENIRLEAVLGAAFAALLSHAQRRLSTPVRMARRRAVAVSGRIEMSDGTSVAITRETLTEEGERALQALAACVVALALALVLMRVT